MPYLNLDDNFADHPKVDALSDGAFRLHVAGLCYCVREDSLWRIPWEAVADLVPKRWNRSLSELLDQDMWRPVPNWGYEIPDVLRSYGLPLWRRQPIQPSRPAIPFELRRAVYERDGHACLHCGATDFLSLDHIHPFSLGGEDTFENLQTLCRPCNSRKGARV